QEGVSVDRDQSASMGSASPGSRLWRRFDASGVLRTCRPSHAARSSETVGAKMGGGGHIGDERSGDVMGARSRVALSFPARSRETHIRNLEFKRPASGDCLPGDAIYSWSSGPDGAGFAGET